MFVQLWLSVVEIVEKSRLAPVVHVMSVNREFVLGQVMFDLSNFREIKMRIILVDDVESHHFLVELILVCRAFDLQSLAAS